MTGPIPSPLTQQSVVPIMDGGWYVSAGVPFNIPFRNAYDFFEIYNYTQYALGSGSSQVIRSYWQNGMPAASAFADEKTATTLATQGSVVTTGGYTLIDTSNSFGSSNLGAPVTSTGITNATPPVVAVSSTAGMVAGQTWRVTQSTGALQLSGMDFTIGTIVTNTSFALSYMIAQGSAATSAVVTQVNNQSLYYPRKRFITNITAATSAVITLSVTHGYNVGEFVQFLVPPVYGAKYSALLNGVRGQITAINTSTNTITVNIDTSSAPSFAFPLTTNVPFTFAQTIPTGELPNLINSATYNTGVLEMNVGSNVCGASLDVLYWKGWKAFRYAYGVLPTS